MFHETQGFMQADNKEQQNCINNSAYVIATTTLVVAHNALGQLDNWFNVTTAALLAGYVYAILLACLTCQDSVYAFLRTIAWSVSNANIWWKYQMYIHIKPHPDATSIFKS